MILSNNKQQFKWPIKFKEKTEKKFKFLINIKNLFYLSIHIYNC